MGIEIETAVLTLLPRILRNSPARSWASSCLVYDCWVNVHDANRLQYQKYHLGVAILSALGRRVMLAASQQAGSLLERCSYMMMVLVWRACKAVVVQEILLQDGPNSI